jgi:hypothetical protein
LAKMSFLLMEMFTLRLFKVRLTPAKGRCCAGPQADSVQILETVPFWSLCKFPGLRFLP